MDLYGVYGASGLGREVMPLVRAQLKAAQVDARLVFIDDASSSAEINGHECLTFPQFVDSAERNKFAVLAIADGGIRSQLSERCVEAGVRFPQVRAANVVEMDDVVFQEGAIVSPFVTMTSNIRIGRHFHANIYSYVAHDCVIGDFVTLAPSVKCNGNVHIEDHAYIGTGAILKQGRPGAPLVIGKGAVVGMGAVVTKSVAPGAVVVGNPAKVMVR